VPSDTHQGLKTTIAQVLGCPKLATAAPQVATSWKPPRPSGWPATSRHWSKLHSTNPLERVNREIGRPTDVVGIVTNDAALLGLAGLLLIEHNDQVQHLAAELRRVPASFHATLLSG
jgi:transposase-like protein